MNDNKFVVETFSLLISMIKSAYDFFCVASSTQEKASAKAAEASAAKRAAYNLPDADPKKGLAFEAARGLLAQANGLREEANRLRAASEGKRKEAADEMRELIGGGMGAGGMTPNDALAAAQAAVVGGKLPPEGLKTLELVSRAADQPQLAANAAKTANVFAVAARTTVVFPGWAEGYYRGVMGLLDGVRGVDRKIEATERRIADLRKEDPRDELPAAERRLASLQEIASHKDAILAELRRNVPPSWFEKGITPHSNLPVALKPTGTVPASTVIQVETEEAQAVDKAKRVEARDAKKAAKAARRYNA